MDNAQELVAGAVAHLIDVTHDAVIVRDLAGIVLLWNRRAESLYGWPREAVTGKPLQTLLNTVWPRPIEEIQAELIEQGRWEGQLAQTRQDGEPITVTTRWVLQRDSQGRPAGVLQVDCQVPPVPSAGPASSGKRQQLLADVGSVTTSSLDYTETLQRLSRLLVRDMADCCAIDLVEDGTVRRVAVAHKDPKCEGVLREVGPQFPSGLDARQAIAQILSVNRRVPTDATVAEQARPSVARIGDQDAVQALGARSAMLVPLLVRGVAIGIIYLVITGDDRVYDTADLVLAEEVAARVALAIDNAWLYRRARYEQARWQATVDSIPDPVTVCNTSGQATYMNAAYSRLIERTIAAELPLEQHAQYYAIYHPDGRAYEAEDLPLQQAVLRNRPVTGMELIHRTPDGRERTFVFNAAPIHDPQGLLLGAVAVGRDITQQRKAESEREKLLDDNRRQREFLERLVQTAPIGIAVVRGPEHRIELMNPAYESIPTGRPGKTALGMPFAEAFPAVAESSALLDRVYANRQTVSAQEYPVPRGGEQGDTYWDFQLIPLMHPLGYVEGVLVLTTDATPRVHSRRALEIANLELADQATELKRRNDELQRVRNELERRVEERTAKLVHGERALRETNRALELSREQSRSLSRRMVVLQEQERQTIARELHDGVGQLLTSLVVGLGVLERRYGGSEEARAHIQYLKDMGEEILAGIHRVGAELRPASLDKLGLLPALRQFLDRFEREQDVHVTFETSGMDGVRLPSEIETALFRIVVEAVTNVMRHASAAEIGVVLTARPGHVTAIVEDDGSGFDPVDAMRHGALGLIGMRERAEMLGGSLAIESAPDSGTTVFAEIPLAA